MNLTNLRRGVNILVNQGSQLRTFLLSSHFDHASSNNFSTSAPLGSLKDANGDTSKKSSGVKLPTPSVPQANPQLSDYTIVMQQAMKSHEVQQTYQGEVGMVDTDVYAAAAKVARKVLIYKPASSASSQGGRSTANESVPQWTIDFGTTQKWESTLMGWTSSQEVLEQVGRPAMKFYNQQQAIVYCEKMGLSYEVKQPFLPRANRQRRFAGYSDNFTVKRGGTPDLSHLPSNTPASMRD